MVQNRSSESWLAKVPIGAKVVLLLLAVLGAIAVLSGAARAGCHGGRHHGGGCASCSSCGGGGGCAGGQCGVGLWQGNAVWQGSCPGACGGQCVGTCDGCSCGTVENVAVWGMPSPAIVRDPNAAIITIHLPADAKVFLDDTPTTSTGLTRTFLTPALTPGETYSYALKVVFADHRAVRKKVLLKAGDDLTVLANLKDAPSKVITLTDATNEK